MENNYPTSKILKTNINQKDKDKYEKSVIPELMGYQINSIFKFEDIQKKSDLSNIDINQILKIKNKDNNSVTTKDVIFALKKMSKNFCSDFELGYYNCGFDETHFFFYQEDEKDYRYFHAQELINIESMNKFLLYCFKLYNDKKLNNEQNQTVVESLINILTPKINYKEPELDNNIKKQIFLGLLNKNFIENDSNYSMIKSVTKYFAENSENCQDLLEIAKKVVYNVKETTSLINYLFGTKKLTKEHKIDIMKDINEFLKNIIIYNKIDYSDKIKNSNSLNDLEISCEKMIIIIEKNFENIYSKQKDSNIEYESSNRITPTALVDNNNKREDNNNKNIAKEHTENGEKISLSFLNKNALGNSIKDNNFNYTL